MFIEDDVELTINFKSASVSRKYKVGELPKESIIALLQYGARRKGNDYVNSAFATSEKTRKELIDEWLEKLENGTLGITTRETGDTEFKAFVISVLKRNGLQAKELKGLDLNALIGICAEKTKTTPKEAEATLRHKFLKVQEAIAEANASFEI